ncbi:MAG: uracil-DNA glycosylase [Oligoflexales bacterium]|nr:uracil-DNA glycosylase [Oligoflexales bacterium]
MKIDSSWKEVLFEEFQKPYMQSLKNFLVQEKRLGKVVYPRGDEIFSAFNLTSFEKVRVVLIGQDPYHGPGQAHGLSFSVKPGVRLPPSLQNIYKELAADLGVSAPQQGFLEPWAAQGVLLLNAVLTVENGSPASHQNRGWEIFTDAVVDVLNRKRENLVFLLWGSYAQAKGAKIDGTRHLVLRSAHPSPLSAYRGFFGSKPFSRINSHLLEHGQASINWSL